MYQVFQNPLFLIGITIFIGDLIGKISLSKFKLGSSGVLFTGLLISFIFQKHLSIITQINKSLLTIALIGFIVSVGLMTTKSLKTTLKRYGFKFILLALAITGTGALMSGLVIGGSYQSLGQTIGAYVGALTSSPGLASALELGSSVDEMPALMGLGYAIAYVPGVIFVIIFAQITGKLSGHHKDGHQERDKGTDRFDLKSFIFVILIGILLGSIKIKLSETMIISLGMTGGTLISALILGSVKKQFIFDFQFDHNKLELMKVLSLNAFLAIVGLNYGYLAISNIQSQGVSLLLVAIIIASSSLLMGLVVGRKILNIEWHYLVGAICGGMTSTPGLAAAIEQFDEEKVVSGYGATYPYALIFMILFTNLLFWGN